MEESVRTTASVHCFIVSSMTATPWQLHIQGDFEERKVCVLNEDSQIVAMALPADDASQGDSYKLRLGPLADSGLIIVAMLAIDRMLRDPRRSPVFRGAPHTSESPAGRG